MANPPQLRPTPAGNPVQALVGEFLEEKKRETREISATRQVSRANRALTVFSAIVCATVWVMPSYIEPADYSPSPQRVEAGARMTVFLAAQRVLAYQKANGRLPSDLAQAGADPNGLTYLRRADSVFEIHALADGQDVAFRSSENPASFLGDAFQVLGSGQ